MVAWTARRQLTRHIRVKPFSIILFDEIEKAHPAFPSAPQSHHPRHRPGDGEVTVVGDETMGEKDPLLARLLTTAAAGTANQRKPLRIVLDPDERPVWKGTFCAQPQGFNLHAATRVAANDKQGRLALCKYILRPPLASRVGSRPALPAANHRGKDWKPSQGFHVDDRLKILDDSNVRLDLKRSASPRCTSSPSSRARISPRRSSPRSTCRQMFLSFTRPAHHLGRRVVVAAMTG